MLCNGVRRPADFALRMAHPVVKFVRSGIFVPDLAGVPSELHGQLTVGLVEDVKFMTGADDPMVGRPAEMLPLPGIVFEDLTFAAIVIPDATWQTTKDRGMIQFWVINGHDFVTGSLHEVLRALYPINHDNGYARVEEAYDAGFLD